MLFRQLFDAESSTYTYLLACERTHEAVMIDPVLEQVDRDLGLIQELGLTLKYSLDTHVHADHVTGSGTLRKATGCKTGVAAAGGVTCVDLSLKDGDVVIFGDYRLDVLATPGHTKSCLTYHLAAQAMLFTGDALLIRGCGRTDFQEGDAAMLYNVIHNKLFSLPDSTQVYPGHDYKGRTVSTVGEEKRLNPRLGQHKTETEFVAIMNGLHLAYPAKIDSALPANKTCGIAQLEIGTHPIAAGPQASLSDDGIYEVTVPWLKEHWATTYAVDVREPHEHDAELGHIQGVDMVPLGTLRKEAQAILKKAAGRPVTFICRSGRRSITASQILIECGGRANEVASLRGGMMAWNDARLPVVRDPQNAWRAMDFWI